MPDRPITIALDARTVHRAHRRGTGKNLIDLYHHVLTARPDWRVIGYHRASGPEADPPAALGGTGRYHPHFIEMPGDRFDAWHQWRLPWAAWRDGADIVHFPSNVCSTWNIVTSLLTVHDLLPLEAEPAIAHRFERSVRHAVQRRWTLITPSHYTAGQLADRFGADPTNIVVNPWAADSAMRPVTDASQLASIRQKYNVPGRFCLHLGAPDARKNTDRVIAAYATLPEATRRNCQLLVVGLDDAEHRSRVIAAAERLDAVQDIPIHGFADEQDMPALFSAAEALIYPSLSEGFGLPILDAWACATPVLTSTATSLPEVAGDAACDVDPTDTSQIREGIETLISDEAYRTDMVRRGIERSRQYNWQATAERFIGAVQNAAQFPDQRTAA